MKIPKNIHIVSAAVAASLVTNGVSQTRMESDGVAAKAAPFDQVELVKRERFSIQYHEVVSQIESELDRGLALNHPSLKKLQNDLPMLELYCIKPDPSSVHEFVWKVEEGLHLVSRQQLNEKLEFLKKIHPTIGIVINASGNSEKDKKLAEIVKSFGFENRFSGARAKNLHKEQNFHAYYAKPVDGVEGFYSSPLSGMIIDMRGVKPGDNMNNPATSDGKPLIIRPNLLHRVSAKKSKLLDEGLRGLYQGDVEMKNEEYGFTGGDVLVYYMSSAYYCPNVVSFTYHGSNQVIGSSIEKLKNLKPEELFIDGAGNPRIYYVDPKLPDNEQESEGRWVLLDPKKGVVYLKNYQPSGVRKMKDFIRANNED